MSEFPSPLTDDRMVIATYQRLAEIHRAMLAAASARDWQAFEQLGQRCAKEVDQIRHIGNMPVQNPVHRREKIELLERILSDDRRIREIVVPWMGEVERLIQPRRRSAATLNLFQRSSALPGQG